MLLHLNISPEDADSLDKLIGIDRVSDDVLHLPLPELLVHLAGVLLYTGQGCPQVGGIVLHLLQEQSLQPHQTSEMTN